MADGLRTTGRRLSGPTAHTARSGAAPASGAWPLSLPFFAPRPRPLPAAPPKGRGLASVRASRGKGPGAQGRSGPRGPVRPPGQAQHPWKQQGVVFPGSDFTTSRGGFGSSRKWQAEDEPPVAVEGVVTPVRSEGR